VIRKFSEEEEETDSSHGINEVLQKKKLQNVPEKTNTLSIGLNPPRPSLSIKAPLRVIDRKAIQMSQQPPKEDVP